MLLSVTGHAVTNQPICIILYLFEILPVALQGSMNWMVMLLVRTAVETHYFFCLFATTTEWKIK